MAKIPDKTDIARTYKPAPLDLSDVRLPESLSELTEVIAANTHEVWSQRRMAEGWSVSRASTGNPARNSR